MRAWPARVGLIALSAGIAMSAVEIAVRILDPYEGRPSISRYHPRREWELVPFRGRFIGEQVYVNDLGFRDHERESPLQVAKPHSTTRIMAFGDSYTFGGEIPVEASYPFQTERQLAELRPAQRWEVINAGVPGYNTLQELRYMQEAVERYEPDLVVLGFELSDAYHYPEPPPETGLRALLRPATNWLSELSYAYHYIPDLWVRLRQWLTSGLAAPPSSPAGTTGSGPAPEAWYQGLYGPRSQHFVATREALHEIDQLLVQRGVPLVVLIYGDLNRSRSATPLIGSFGDVYPFEWVHRQLADVLATGHGQVLDAIDVLADLPALDVYEREAHPGPRANAAVSAALARCIIATLDRAHGPARSAAACPR